MPEVTVRTLTNRDRTLNFRYSDKHKTVTITQSLPHNLPVEVEIDNAEDIALLFEFARSLERAAKEASPQPVMAQAITSVTPDVVRDFMAAVDSRLSALEKYTGELKTWYMEASGNPATRPSPQFGENLDGIAEGVRAIRSSL